MRYVVAVYVKTIHLFYNNVSIKRQFPVYNGQFLTYGSQRKMMFQFHTVITNVNMLMHKLKNINGAVQTNVNRIEMV